MTTKIKGYPFEVLIGGEPPAAVLADQVKSLDWRAWKARKKGAASSVEIDEITAKAAALLGIKNG